MGLEEKKKGHVWWGISPISNEIVTIVVHEHAGGRDISKGLLDKYIKELGFKNDKEFFEFLNKI
ncbi:MAG: hypothetical protein QME46_03965 [Thermoanaerobacteraceae bacterium]|nr:hypothetical protein [Thermoanaerobacteraceae bacterium]